MSTLDGDNPCEDCGTRDNIIWFTDDWLWNDVCPDEGILCIRCFVARVERAGYQALGWRVLPVWTWVKLEQPEPSGNEHHIVEQ